MYERVDIDTFLTWRCVRLKSKYFTIHIVINHNVYGVNKNMKTNIILIAVFVAAFMFPSIRSVDTANAETNISHCANLEATAARPACESAANVKPANKLDVSILDDPIGHQ